MSRFVRVHEVDSRDVEDGGDIAWHADQVSAIDQELGLPSWKYLRVERYNSG